VVSDELWVGVDYQPAATGPFLWQAFNIRAVDSDLAAIAAAGFRLARVGLAWDSFMPDARGVSRRRLAELDLLLRSAQAHGLRLILALFVQAHGDCVFLPGRTVVRGRARSHVRVMSEGLLELGQPRDPWTDPLMLELAERWSSTMAAEFGGHPAVAAWDLGEDPATVARPRRIADLPAWAELAGRPFRERGDMVRLTLGVDDVCSARGLRLATLAPHLDAVDIALRVDGLRHLELRDASIPLFIAQLAQRLASDSSATPLGLTDASSPTPVGVAIAVPSGEAAPSDPVEDETPARNGGMDDERAAAVVDELSARHADAGVASLRAIRWSDLEPRLGERPPFDRAPWLLRSGLVRTGGEAKPALQSWSRMAAAELEQPQPRPWPPRLDTEAFYASVPESLLDLAKSWRDEHEDRPAILDHGEA